MEQQQESHSCLVMWHGQKLTLEINPDSSVNELGNQLQKLTNVKPDTLRLLVPNEKGSTMLYPFSDQHSHLSLDEASIFKGKSIRMMGVLENEVDEVLQNAKVDLRIAGFDEEEKRMKSKYSNRTYTSRKLPQGPYIFCDFKTLSIPGIELNPPASKALELLHMLASDPGIVAILNKHRWWVGILTEMAPIGYVGVSPKCILGVNKNHGEEISLRLRTDDLNGFRKYDSIKKTLLHELAHMVHSEHDANFYALNKQLNEEAATLDWTKSRSHTTSGLTYSPNSQDEFGPNSPDTTSQKLGGQASALPNARTSSVNAAYQRLANTSTTSLRIVENAMELDAKNNHSETPVGIDTNVRLEGNTIVDGIADNTCVRSILPLLKTVKDEYSNMDSLGGASESMQYENTMKSDQMHSLMDTSTDIHCHVVTESNEPVRNNSHAGVMQIEPTSGEVSSTAQTIPADLDVPELQIIHDPVTLFCGRLQNEIQLLKNEVHLSEFGMTLQTLIKIIRNIIEHPNEKKFKKIRKANPMVQKNIVRYKAAVDILILIGFLEDVVNEDGKADISFVLKRNDPGLLWLAKSSLESYIVS